MQNYTSFLSLFRYIQPSNLLHFMEQPKYAQNMQFENGSCKATEKEDAELVLELPEGESTSLFDDPDLGNLKV
jgi:hypothetical protein